MRFKQSLVKVLIEALLAGREISVGHAEDSATITSVATVADNVSATPLQVDAIEITQAIQDLAQSVPLFAGKRTVVRVYLSHYSSAGITVRGELSIRRGASAAPLTVSSANTVVLDLAQAGDIPVKRDDVTRSLNFVLPDSHITEGPLSIRIASITNAVTNTPVSFGSERRPTVWFHDTAPVRVRVLGMRYTQSSVTHTPSNLDFALIESWLRRAFPTGQVVMSMGTVDVTASVPFSCGDINAQVAAIRALDVAGGTDARTHYYGLVSDGGFFMRGCAAGIPQTPQPGTVASGPTGSGTWGWDFDGSYGDWYTGHELGHTYGRRHPGFCGESQSDLDNYPFVNGQLANSNATFAGFDVGDPANGLGMVALPGTQWHDVMTYCDFQWLCAYTYLGVRRRLAEEGALSAGPAPGPSSGFSTGGRPDARFPHQTRSLPSVVEEGRPSTALVSVVATANLTRTAGKVRYVNPLERALASDVPAKTSAYLRVKGAAGEVLGDDYPVEVKLNSELRPGEDLVGIIDAIIPVPTNARSIELVIDQQVVDTFAVGGGIPRVFALRAVETAGKDLALTADVQGALAENQTYCVQVTTDNGRTWQTMGVGLKHPSVALDRGQFRGGQEIRVRIIATDGLTSSVVTTETFHV